MLKSLEERHKTYVVAEESDDVRCPYIYCAHGMGLAGNGCCEIYGDWDNSGCLYFILTKDYEQNGLIDRIQERIDRITKLTEVSSDDVPYLKSKFEDIKAELKLTQADLKILKELRG